MTDTQNNPTRFWVLKDDKSLVSRFDELLEELALPRHQEKQLEAIVDDMLDEAYSRGSDSGYF